jgi:RNA polymerase sigma factor (sigma-70 family)
VEASALPTRLTAGRAPFSAAFLRLRSDDQLVALFRSGSDDAFRAIHERYRARLLAYTRQMLRGACVDPEDALQDVFVRAYRSLRSSERPVMLRAWLYRIAHNRCIDELRRPCPVPSELAPDAQPAFVAPAASREPPAVAERSAALARLVADVRTLPSQQRSALLMRELQGLSYEELAGALAISVPAVKSLLLRARTALIDISAARETPCLAIRAELLEACDRGARTSGRARRHCGECADCATYRSELRRIRAGFASLTPAGPLAQLGMLLGIGGGGGGAAAIGGGGAAAGGGTIAGATVAKIAVAVCCAALITTAGRAVIAPPAKAPARAQRRSHSALDGAATAGALGAARVMLAGTVAPLTRELPTHASAPHPQAPARRHADGGTPAALGATGPSGPTAAAGASATLIALGASGATGPSGAAAVTGATGTTGTGGAPGAIGAAAEDPTGATGTHYDAGRAPSGASGAGGTTAASGGD